MDIKIIAGLTNIDLTLFDVPHTMSENKSIVMGKKVPLSPAFNWNDFQADKQQCFHGQDPRCTTL